MRKWIAAHWETGLGMALLVTIVVVALTLGGCCSSYQRESDAWREKVGDRAEALELEAQAARQAVARLLDVSAAQDPAADPLKWGAAADATVGRLVDLERVAGELVESVRSEPE